MIHENYDIEKIEADLEKAVIASGASKNVFVGNRPKTGDDKMTDFIVVRVVTELKDWDAYGKAVSRIEVYAKNQANGVKNKAKVSFLMGKIRAIFPIESNFCIFDETAIIPLGNDDFGFNVTAVNINTLITI